MATKPASGPRELITPHKGDSRYQRRNPNGTFNEGDKVSRAQPDDKAHKSKTVPPKGQGDKGDHKPAKKALTHVSFVSANDRRSTSSGARIR